MTKNKGMSRLSRVLSRPVIRTIIFLESRDPHDKLCLSLGHYIHDIHDIFAPMTAPMTTSTRESLDSSDNRDISHDITPRQPPHQRRT